MGLKQELQDEFAEAFDEDFSDAVRELWLIKTEGIYQTGTGKKTSIDIPDPKGNGKTRGMVVGNNIKENSHSGGAIKRGSHKCVIITNEIILEPSIDDVISDENNRYTILSYNSDALGVVYNINMEKQ